MGRGGAGNWYEPKVLSETGIFETSVEQPASSSSRLPDKEITSETRQRGRGGAGNFVWDEDESGKEKEIKEIELKEMVAKDVELGLAKPDRAFIRQWDD